MRQACALLQHIKITDLLLEVDRWTGFSRHFTHLKTGQPCEDRKGQIRWVAKRDVVGQIRFIERTFGIAEVLSANSRLINPHIALCDTTRGNPKYEFMAD